jgi:hypothetical protein
MGLWFLGVFAGHHGRATLGKGSVVKTNYCYLRRGAGTEDE